MRILFSQLPQSPWWGKGYSEAYENNWAMQEGNLPNQTFVEKEHKGGLSLLQKYCEIEIIPFPKKLDVGGLYKHDGVFVRDSLISNQRGEIVVANFRERLRQPELEHIEKHVVKRGHRVHHLPSTAFAEGGEFFYIPKQNILFAGLSRNNEYGVRQTAKLLGIKKVFIIKSKSFHLDTLFCIALNKKGELAALLACLDLIDNVKEVKAFAKELKVPLLPLDEIDSIGKNGKGRISVNCLAIPGVLLGGSKFLTKGIERELKRLKIIHAVSPITQFLLSGGGIHCLTNELLS